MLSRKTTMHALLADYPFLAEFLTRRDRVFDRLHDPSSAGRWARVVTVDEVAVEMDVPWLDLLREIQAEILRVTGAAPSIAGAAPVTSGDNGLADDVRSLVGELERGAPLDVLAARLDELTLGLDADAVAALAARPAAGVRPVGESSWPAGGPADLPDTSTALQPCHPIAALYRECDRLARLADLVEEIVDGMGDPPDAERLEEARVPLLGLLDRLRELERQARRLRLAWYATVSSRTGPSVVTLVAERIDEALDGLARLRAAVSGDEAAAVVVRARTGVALVRRALVATEELLAPAAYRALDDDDWEAVAEQERAVGWALDSGQAL